MGSPLIQLTPSDISQMAFRSAPLKHFLIALSLVFSLNAASQNYYQATISYLNVREGAGVTFKVTGQLNKNETVQVLSVADGWAHVINSDKTLDGYVYVRFLKKVTDDARSNNNKAQSAGANEADDPHFLTIILRFNWIIAIIGGFITAVLSSFFIGGINYRGKISSLFRESDIKAIVAKIGNISILPVYGLIWTFLVIKFILPVMVHIMGIGFGSISVIFIWLFGAVFVPLAINMIQEKSV